MRLNGNFLTAIIMSFHHTTVEGRSPLASGRDEGNFGPGALSAIIGMYGSPLSKGLATRFQAAKASFLKKLDQIGSVIAKRTTWLRGVHLLLPVCPAPLHLQAHRSLRFAQVVLFAQVLRQIEKPAALIRVHPLLLLKPRRLAVHALPEHLLTRTPRFAFERWHQIVPIQFDIRRTHARRQESGKELKSRRQIVMYCAIG